MMPTTMTNDNPELLIEASDPRQPESGVAVGSTCLSADMACLLAGFAVEYYNYDCGGPCAPDGCRGHATDIPLSFMVGGVIFHVDGAQSGDFPDGRENVNRVRAVVKALGSLISANDTLCHPAETERAREAVMGISNVPDQRPGESPKTL